MLRAKSEKFKALRKLVVIPSIFNINEPLIFGVPIMLNPIFFFPMVTSVMVAGAVIHIFYSLGILNYMNPTVELPLGHASGNLKLLIFWHGICTCHGSYHHCFNIMVLSILQDCG